ncbi:MAG: metallophosphoesterase [Porphyromonadaceae bacterium CG2_30_38_12]|nr:MAG: metallophosphoesterase [Porphyromonadaceae bacterium CG2_30_38_12]
MKRSILFIVLLINVFTYSQTVVKGFVFDDKNANEKLDKNEQGISNVAVSNGKEVVLTNASGEYRIEVGNDNIVFIIKPSGYAFKLDEYNIPKYFYCHKPLGSPAFQYKAFEPTGKLPKNVNFGLAKIAESDNFTGLIFGDPQPYFKEQIDFFSKSILADVITNNHFNAIFGISLGDITGDNPDLHLPYKQAIKSIGLPWYNVMGNHDMNYDAKTDSLSDESFEAHFGPNNFSFNYGKAHFIILDNILYPDPRDGNGYWGGFRTDQLQFVENDLKYVDNDKLVVISLHIPLDDKEEGEIAFRQPDRKKLYDLLKNHKNVLILSAHSHFQYQSSVGKEQGIARENPIHEFNVGASCGDWYSGVFTANGYPITTMRDGTPLGYALIRVNGNKYELDYKVVEKPVDYRMSIYNAKVVPQRKSDGWSSYSVYANVFLASENDVVEYRIDNGEWSKMSLVKEVDPAYVRYAQDWDYIKNLELGRRPSEPIVCLHLWKALLKSTLSLGNHTVEVRAKDRFGRVFTQQSTYAVAKDPTLELLK